MIKSLRRAQVRKILVQAISDLTSPDYDISAFNVERREDDGGIYLHITAIPKKKRKRKL